MDRMMQLRNDEGKTIFFISHSLEQVREFCTTAMWIEGGSLVEYGPVEEVSRHYSEYVDMLNSLKGKEKKAFLDAKFESRLLPKKPAGFFTRLKRKLRK
jgi:teichoic acid transport system ATP-binding protein